MLKKRVTSFPCFLLLLFYVDSAFLVRTETSLIAVLKTTGFFNLQSDIPQISYMNFIIIRSAVLGGLLITAFGVYFRFAVFTGLLTPFALGAARPP